MANVVGSLVVKLSAHIADFTSGLQRAGSKATSFASSMESSFGSGSLVVGNFGVAAAAGLDHVGKSAAKVEKTVSGSMAGMRRAFETLGRLGLGRGVFGPIAGLSGGSMAAVAGLAIVAAAVKMGNALREAKDEAVKLGVSYETLQAMSGEIAISKGAQQGLEDVSNTFSTLWTAAKGIGQELLGWTFYTAQLLSDFLRLGKLDLDLYPDKAKDAKRISQMEKDLAKLQSLDDMVKGMVAGLDDAGKSELDKMISDIERKNPGGDNAARIAIVTDAYNRKIERTRPKPMEWNPYPEGSDEKYAAMEKFQEMLDKNERIIEALAESGRQLAETPIDRFAEKMKALNAAIDAGLDPAKAEAAKKKLRESTAIDIAKELEPPNLGAASAMVGGSRELWNAIADASSKGVDRQLDIAQRQLRVQEDILQAERDKVVMEGNIP